MPDISSRLLFGRRGGGRNVEPSTRRFFCRILKPILAINELLANKNIGEKEDLVNFADCLAAIVEVCEELLEVHRRLLCWHVQFYEIGAN